MDIWSIYPEYKNTRFTDRYIDPTEWVAYCQELPSEFKVANEGCSEEGRTILQLKWGTGKRHLLLWSQMHGNEPTATLAISDLFNLLSNGSTDARTKDLVNGWMNEFTFHFIPILNPDGAIRYQRRNANGIDINRDAVKQATAESRFFWDLMKEIKPELGFNLHDQRTMYSAGHTDNPATISFLAPSPDAERSVNAARVKSISLGGYLTQVLRPHLGDCIARYSDEFYPTSFGDNLQKQDIPVLLIESGESATTPNREETRRANFFCLAAGFTALQNDQLSENHSASYFALPENQVRFFDLILTSVSWKGGVTDVGLRCQEKLVDGRLRRVFEVADIGDLRFSPRFAEFDADGFSWEGSVELEKEPQATFEKDGRAVVLDRYAEAFIGK